MPNKICEQCKQQFFAKENENRFCSQVCYGKTRRRRVFVKCSQCNKEIYKLRKTIKKSKTNRFFCNHSCRATYQNTHKTTGYRRSKLELYLEEQLIILYPKLDLLFNDKTAVNSELDIYIPSLKLAFELNGIFHYEPIFGKEQLDKIQNNDGRKFQACLEHKIELCIIDASQQKYFKESTSQKYLDIVVSIIKRKIQGSNLHHN